MYHASPAYLPSSFAMCTAMLGFSAFMDGRGDRGTAPGIFWFACGALLGWPFAGALIFPFILEQAWLALSSGELLAGFTRFINGALRSLTLLASITIHVAFLFSNFLSGFANSHRLLLLPEARLCATEHCALQCLQWRQQGP
jgi:alpha-1,2-mannosyltransferase